MKQGVPKPILLMNLCCYCDGGGDTVITVATCNGTCEGIIKAHPECFFNRKQTQVYRKKMKQRTNRDAEVCPHAGCLGKVLVSKKDSIVGTVVTAQAKKHARTVFDTFENVPNAGIRTQGSDGCTFLGRDGTPCRRTLVVDTAACKHHQRDWRLMQQMLCVPCGTANDSSTLKLSASPPTKEVATQTEDSDLLRENKELELRFLKAFRQLRCDKEEAEDRLASIRTNVLDLLMQ